jgi:hypothetical protein
MADITELTDARRVAKLLRDYPGVESRSIINKKKERALFTHACCEELRREQDRVDKNMRKHIRCHNNELNSMFIQNPSGVASEIVEHQ